MTKLRASISGIIGPKNLSSILTFAKYSDTNAKLIDARNPAAPFRYVLQFDYIRQHDLYYGGELRATLYEYGGTHFIVHFMDPPHCYIYRSTARPESRWSFRGEEVSFRLEEQKDHLLVYRGAPVSR